MDFEGRSERKRRRSMMFLTLRVLSNISSAASLKAPQAMAVIAALPGAPSWLET